MHSNKKIAGVSIVAAIIVALTLPHRMLPQLRAQQRPASQDRASQGTRADRDQRTAVTHDAGCGKSAAEPITLASAA